MTACINYNRITKKEERERRYLGKEERKGKRGMRMKPRGRGRRSKMARGRISRVW